MIYYELIFHTYYRSGTPEWYAAHRVRHLHDLTRLRTRQIMLRYRVQQEDN